VITEAVLAGLRPLLQQLLQKYGLTAEHVVAAAKEQIARVRRVAEPV
jgi:hypothetical protein